MHTYSGDTFYSTLVLASVGTDFVWFEQVTHQ